MWIIVDLDGTLALTGAARVSLARERRWAEFHSLLDGDKLNQPVWEILNGLTAHFPIMIATGRPERYREATRSWLARHRVPFSRLLMREDADHRPDTVAKREMISREGLTPDKVLMILEDRDRMVDMWRAAGFTCFQVAKGEF